VVIEGAAALVLVVGFEFPFVPLSRWGTRGAMDAIGGGPTSLGVAVCIPLISRSEVNIGLTALGISTYIVRKTVRHDPFQHKDRSCSKPPQLGQHAMGTSVN
jgi:hypothetical protein